MAEEKFNWKYVISIPLISVLTAVGIYKTYLSPKPVQPPVSISARENPIKGLEKEVTTQETTIPPARQSPKTTPLETLANQEFLNPEYEKDDNFTSDSQRNVLARLFYGEARGELDNEDYLYGIGRTIINRAKKKNETPKEIATKWGWKEIKDKRGRVTQKIKVWQYTCFDTKDKNYRRIKSPLKYGKEEIWNECYSLAKDTLEEKAPSNQNQKELETATNYWVDFVKTPYWAHEDNNKKKPLRKPIAVIPVMGGKYKASFYNFKHP